ncbi:MAG: hypothetical protein QNJ65_15135 [Xenococcaceae cyanobacterium MO_234.B1]|nr:hypothetical protein [Xenococcaceae cyanobacterium MO_234.B1]
MQELNSDRLGQNQHPNLDRHCENKQILVMSGAFLILSRKMAQKDWIYWVGGDGMPNLAGGLGVGR